jgi:hypothetical protein
MTAIQALIDDYITSVGETPCDRQLERLTDEILYEELTDKDRYKAKHDEYPIFTERQLDLRTSGDITLNAAAEEGTDGKCYRQPSRRKRTFREEVFVDKKTKSRNKERCAQYREDSKNSDVITI